jgi:integrase
MNPKVTHEKGPAQEGKRGPWEYARCDRTRIPIFKSVCRGKVLFQVPCTTSEDKPTKRSFRDLKEAELFAKQLALLPPRAAATFSAIPREQLLLVVEALDILESVLRPLGISPEAGIEEYAGAKAQVGQKDLREIVRAYCAEPWVKKGRTPLGEVIEQFIAAKKGAHHRPSYVYTLRRNLRRLSVESGAPAIGEVTKQQLVGVIRGAGGPRSQKTFQTSFRTFFKWSKLQDYLHPAKPTEAEKLDKIIVANPPPGIYTVPEARRILGEITDVPSLLYIALSFFTGIRQIELGRIDWTAINTDGVIDVDASKEKRYRRRLVPIQPVLRAWLSPFYGCTGLIVPFTQMRQSISQIITSLGIKYQRNGFRHSYASYRLSQTDSVMQTSQEDGHSAYVLEHDYLHRVTREQALEFFKLTPVACGQTNWRQKVAEHLGTNPPIKERRTRKSAGPWPIVPRAETEPAEAASQPSAITAPPSAGEEEGEQRAAA